jgi:hypothetical protein
MNGLKEALVLNQIFPAIIHLAKTFLLQKGDPITIYLGAVFKRGLCCAYMKCMQ